MARKQFTTTIDEQLLEQLKIEAIKTKADSNDIIEEALRAYFEAKEKEAN